METLTFYSYKGGVGRTLAVANAALYLSRFKKNVLAVDFDLEAPGLHYKLTRQADGQPQAPRPAKGIVDYISEFMRTGMPPEDLSSYVVEVQESSDDHGRIHMMGAGAVPTREYWESLAQISWHELFYSARAPGVGLFLELKSNLEETFSPDFMLIDARTGVTEIGGVATTILPDKLVCLMLANSENLEGAREILRSVWTSPRLGGQAPITILPVLTRIPASVDADTERKLCMDVQDFLNAEADDLARSLSVSEVYIFHSEPELQIQETVRIGGDLGPGESPLLRDYLTLFAKLVPQEEISPYVIPLVEDALARAFDDPNRAERDLEALASYSRHPRAFEALLKYRRLAKSDSEVLIKTASDFWEACQEEAAPLAWEVVREHSAALRSYRATDYPLDTLIGMWKRFGQDDAQVGQRLAQLLTRSSRVEEAIDILNSLLDSSSFDESTVLQLLGVLSTTGDMESALALVDRYKLTFGESPRFQGEWAQLGDQLKGRKRLSSIVDDPAFNLELAAQSSPSSVAELLRRVGRQDEAKAVLSRALDRAAREGPSRDLIEMGALFQRLGMSKEFEDEIRSRFSERNATEILRELRRR